MKSVALQKDTDAAEASCRKLVVELFLGAAKHHQESCEKRSSCETLSREQMISLGLFLESPSRMSSDEMIGFLESAQGNTAAWASFFKG